MLKLLRINKLFLAKVFNLASALKAVAIAITLKYLF
jgi:hypothetical protein